MKQSEVNLIKKTLYTKRSNEYILDNNPLFVVDTMNTSYEVFILIPKYSVSVQTLFVASKMNQCEINKNLYYETK